MLYNEPTGFGVDYTPEMLAELAHLDTLVAIKELTAQSRRVTELALRFGDRFLCFCGQDDIILESMVLGCVGWVCATGSAFARETVLFNEHCAAGRIAEARELYRWMYPLLHLDMRSTFIQCGKVRARHVRPRLGAGPLAAAAARGRRARRGDRPSIERMLATRPSLPQPLRAA